MTDGTGALGDVSEQEACKLAKYVNERAGKETVTNSVFLKKPSPEEKQARIDRSGISKRNR
jgi:hypothetical protein